MKTFHIPTLILSALFVGFIGFVIASSAQLPERVATHFDLSGQPNGWMPRSSHVLFMLMFGSAFPLMVPVLAFAARYLPDTAINIPRRDYWLGTGQRDVTFAYLFRHSIWFACLGVGFAAGIQYLIVQANVQTSGQMMSSSLLSLTGCFLVGLACWVIAMLRHFCRKD